MAIKFDLSALSGFDMTDAADAPTFRTLEPGEYTATVDAVDLTVSKTSGAPMFVLDYTIDDGEGGKVSLRDYVMLAFKARNGGTRRNPRFRKLALAAGAKADKPNPSAEELKKVCSAIGTKIPGRPVMLTLEIQEGRPDGKGGNYPDRNQVRDFRFEAAEDPLAGLEL